jgi:hypothetical protein
MSKVIICSEEAMDLVDDGIVVDKGTMNRITTQCGFDPSAKTLLKTVDLKDLLNFYLKKSNYDD